MSFCGDFCVGHGNAPFRGCACTRIASMARLQGEAELLRQQHAEDPGHPDAAEVLASMLSSATTNYRHLPTVEDAAPEVVDEIVEPSDEEDESDCSDIDAPVPTKKRKVGQPRIEDKYGHEFVDFVTDYVNTRGTMKLKDTSRSSANTELLTVPLSHLAEKCAEKGWKLHPTTVGNLFLPGRKDAKNTRKRGVIKAKRASIILSESHWGARCRYSAHGIRMAKHFFLESMKKSFATVAQTAVDECASQGIWIAGRSRKKASFMLVDDNGDAFIKNWSHSFPLASNFVMKVSGVVKVTKAKVGRPSLAPSKMYAYVRSNRYHPGGSHPMARDLARTVQLDDDIREADIWMSVSDKRRQLQLRRLGA